MEQLHIDKDFKEFIPPLAKEEYEQLEKNIVAYGCREPLSVWNGFIIDGHNRYEICQKHNIRFSTVNVELSDRCEVFAWMFENQKGRRNLTDFAMNEMAMKREKFIREEMKKRMQLSEGRGNKRSDQMVIPFEPTSTRKELAKLANTSEGSIQRTKYILENGTEEQISRARKGGNGNSIGAIEREIKEANEEKKECACCKRLLPISSFGAGRTHCFSCRKKNSNGNAVTDLKGNSIRISEELRHLTEADIIGDLYDTEKVIDYTVDDLKDEISATADNFEWSISNCLEMHKELLKDDETKKKVFEVITMLQGKLNQLKERY